MIKRRCSGCTPVFCDCSIRFRDCLLLCFSDCSLCFSDSSVGQELNDQEALLGLHASAAAPSPQPLIHAKVMELLQRFVTDRYKPTP